MAAEKKSIQAICKDLLPHLTAELSGLDHTDIHLKKR